ncbi:MAG: hypothetical protein JWP91_4657 [Fibrobacteres bacterium]|nr:hypothetical protein [Fibrobacterota bacterium]
MNDNTRELGEEYSDEERYEPEASEQAEVPEGLDRADEGLIDPDDIDGEDEDGGEEAPGFRRGIPTTPPDLQESIKRLDALLASADDEEKIKAGMGIRLALGMAQELKSGKQLGSETGDLVAGWVKTYGQEVVETAVRVAREFLVKPEAMRKTLGSRLTGENPE